MRFQALSIGAEVPTHCFSGTVHSVFHNACNIRIEPHRLLTLLSSEKGNVPQGVRLSIPSQVGFLDLFRAGQPVACRGGILRSDGPELSVDLRTAILWHIDLKELGIDVRLPAQAQSWAVAWSELKKTCRHRSGLSSIVAPLRHSDEQSISSATSKVLRQQATHTIPALLRATRDFQLHNALTSVRPLIGLGPGLTPSGDDFLVGYLAGLWCTAGNDPSRIRFLTVLGSELSEAARNTNDVSYAYLRSATKGHVSEPIAKLAQQLKQPNNMSSVRAAAQTALQIGHTSGGDGVLGLLLGCIAWQRRLSTSDVIGPS